jgi:hypothetical protein
MQWWSGINYFADLRMTFRQNFFLQDWFRNKFGVGFNRLGKGLELVFGVRLVWVKPLLCYVLSLWGQRNNGKSYFADLRMTFRQKNFLQDWFRNKLEVGLGTIHYLWPGGAGKIQLITKQNVLTHPLHHKKIQWPPLTWILKNNNLPPHRQYNKFSELNNLPPPSTKKFRSVYHFRVKKFFRTCTLQMLYSDFTSIFSYHCKIRKFTQKIILKKEWLAWMRMKKNDLC